MHVIFMRAVGFESLEGPSGIDVIDRPWPTAGPGEAVVEVSACSINRHDLWILNGDSAMVGTDDLPFVSGLDVAGEVTAVGEGVEAIAPGDRVLLCPNQTCGTCRRCRTGPETQCASFSLFHGGFAEAIRVDAARLLRIPDGVSSTRAATLPTAYLTAFRMLRIAGCGPGDRVFIPGVTGGVGIAGVQLASLAGARTIGTSSSSQKLGTMRELGLDVPIEGTDPDSIENAMSDVEPVDIGLDHLGGPYTALTQRLLCRGGVIVICGRTVDSTAPIDVPRLFLEQQRIHGSTMGTQPELERLLGLLGSGMLDPVVDRTFPLSAAEAAFQRMADRAHVGKIVLKP